VLALALPKCDPTLPSSFSSFYLCLFALILVDACDHVLLEP
jgi:hypothetical protein